IRRGPTDRMSSKLLSVVLMNNALDVASQPRRAHFSQVKGRHASATHPPVTRGRRAYAAASTVRCNVGQNSLPLRITGGPPRPGRGGLRPHLAPRIIPAPARAD